MNTLSLTTPSTDSNLVQGVPAPLTPRDEKASEPLDEMWFDEAPRSSVPPRSSSAPISVGGFLGDPLADAWLR